MWERIFILFLILAGTIVTNAEPVLVWSRLLSGNGSAGCRSLLVTENGDLLLAGQTGLTGQNADLYLIRLNTDGDTIWTRTYGTMEENESAWDLRVTPEGYYHAAGLDFAVCFDDNGDSLWTRSVTRPSWEITNMKITNDGGYVFSGWGAALAKYDSSGQELWMHYFDAIQPIGCIFGLIATSDGGFLGTG